MTLASNGLALNPARVGACVCGGVRVGFAPKDVYLHPGDGEGLEMVMYSWTEVPVAEGGWTVVTEVP